MAVEVVVFALPIYIATNQREQPQCGVKGVRQRGARARRGGALGRDSPPLFSSAGARVSSAGLMVNEVRFLASLSSFRIFNSGDGLSDICAVERG